MCAAMARAYDKMTRDYFTGAVYLTTTLTLAAGEAEHFVYFAERGFRVGIGHMTSAGGSAPVTLAGAVALHLAETVFINIIRRAFYGGREFPIGCTVAPLDMRTLIYPYGRPERQLANAMMADMAKQYGTAFHAHAGHAEAKRPSAEAGAQRALTSIPTLMCGGRTQVAAGLLSTDQVFSPIQMIIDNEFIGALKRFSRGCVVSEDTLAVDVIREVGPGNLFIDHQHTVDHFRTEHWEPDLWSREMFDAWMAQGARTDVDKARERYHEIVALPDQPFGFSEETDRELRGIMEKAERDLR